MSTIHPAKISKVLPDSIAAEIGFEVGMRSLQLTVQIPAI